jgi:DNA-binding MarR family transcriptional regulator
MNNETNKELYHSLKRLNRLMHRVGHHGMGEHGLHRGQVYLLKTINQNDGLVQRDLAEILDIRPSSITEFLVKMEQDGLVLRKQDDKDQRLMHIHLTEQGRKAIESTDGTESGAYNSLFSCLTTEESSAMVAICNKLCDNLDGENKGEEDMRHHDHKFHHHSHDDYENSQEEHHFHHDHHDEHHADCKCHDEHHNEHHSHHDCKGHSEHHSELSRHDCKGHGEHHGHHCCKENNEINPQPDDSSKPE